MHVGRARGGALVTTLLAALVLPRRAVPLALLAALVALAQPAAADLVLVADDAPRITRCARHVYRPLTPFSHAEHKRSVLANDVVIQSLAARASVTNNYARTVVTSEHVNESEESKLVAFFMHACKVQNLIFFFYLNCNSISIKSGISNQI